MPCFSVSKHCFLFHSQISNPSLESRSGLLPVRITTGEQGVLTLLLTITQWITVIYQQRGTKVSIMADGSVIMRPSLDASSVDKSP